MLKALIKSILIAFAILVIAGIAAPFLVSQEKVISFVEKQIELSDNKKLKIESPVKFGFFPYAYFETDKASIISSNGIKQTIENLLFGFDFNDLITKNIDFDLEARYQGVDYKANVALDNYSNFIDKKPTKVNINFETPVPFELVGDLVVDEKSKKLNDFTITHKQTTAKGNMEFRAEENNAQFIKGDVVIDTKNIDDIRRLLDFDNYNSNFSLTSGKGKIIISFDTLGSNKQEYLKTLNAEGSLKISDAAVYGLDLKEIVQTFGQVEFQETSSKKIDINSADSSFIIANSVAKIINFNAVNPMASINSNGIIHLIKETTDTNFDINANIEGTKVNLPLRIYGPFKDPKIRAKAINAVINNTEGLRKITDQINDDKVKDTINSVFDVLNGGSR